MPAQPAIQTNNTGLNSLLAGMGGQTGALLQQRSKVMDTAQAGAQQTQQKLQGLTDQRGPIQKPAAPALGNINATPPQYHQLEPIQAFQNWGVVLAMFGSLLTRAPITAAFKSGAAAMKAFHQNDLQGFEIQRQSWKDGVDAALQQNRIELEKYDAALRSSEFDMSKLSAQFQGIAAANKDQVMLATLQAGNIDQAISIVQHREDMAQKLKALGMQHDLRMDVSQRADQALQERIRHDRAMEGISGGKITSANDLTGLVMQTDAIDQIVSAHQGMFDSLTGTAGQIKRGIQDVTGQLGINLFPQANDLKNKIVAFQTQLTRPFLKAHYFTAATIARIEELAKGLNFDDDPAGTINAYRTIKGILLDQQKALQSSGTAGPDNISNMTNDALQQLQDQLLQSDGQ